MALVNHDGAANVALAARVGWSKDSFSQFRLYGRGRMRGTGSTLLASSLRSCLPRGCETVVDENRKPFRALEDCCALLGLRPSSGGRIEKPSGLGSYIYYKKI